MLLKRGFTLIEMLLVICILGILAALISGNFINSLKKGRDARRKADLGNIQRALEMYYEDNKTYAVDLTKTNLCLPSFEDCTKKAYMLNIPTDPSTKSSYDYSNIHDTDYKICANLENNKDSQCTIVGSDCQFCICSSNITCN
jgi:general secretion pathway protein G